MIVVATSGANDCLYCIVAHGAILFGYAKNPLVAEKVANELPQGRHHRAAEGHAGLRAQGGEAKKINKATNNRRAATARILR